MGTLFAKFVEFSKKVKVNSFALLIFKNASSRLMVVIPSVAFVSSISHCTIVKVSFGGRGLTEIADSPIIGHSLGSAKVIFKRYFPASLAVALVISK